MGERLAAARREQGLSLEDLADRLRLGTEQLTALETGDHRHLPEAVFVVAQAKRVAGALGIDVSQQISDLQTSRLMRVGRSPVARPPLQRKVRTPTAPARRSGPPAGCGRPWFSWAAVPWRWRACRAGSPPPRPPGSRHRPRPPARPRRPARPPHRPLPRRHQGRRRISCCWRAASPAGWRCARPPARPCSAAPSPARNASPWAAACGSWPAGPTW
ncbi:helix-turn-helix domain-containing protein [Cyanobium gracile]|uniref:helix-turn-helix domain-containing protein n=1 Tax=Cyanobium gracile TaxID=59930 RepID=UPI003CCC172E